MTEELKLSRELSSKASSVSTDGVKEAEEGKEGSDR
jgi:hypothetical protein